MAVNVCRRGVLAGLVAGLALAIWPAGGVSSPERHSTAAAGTLVLDQEFNGAAGARLDRHLWSYARGGEPQWGNQEWEYYTDRSANVSMDGKGHLAIVARRQRLSGMAHCMYGPCNVTSARITTQGKFAQKYGRFEARMKLPRGAGLWPAFWMLGRNSQRVGWPACGEIDAMEVIGRQPNTVYGTIHARGYADDGIGGKKTVRPWAPEQQFHVYEIDWSPSTIRWKLDGRTYFVVRRSQLRPGQAWPFVQPFYIIINLAVGGTWPGPPNRHTHFPARMLIDWVRVYKPLAG
jgi:beta-glucanase (GH16 family)